jgi:hypothetical protein
MAFLDSFRTGTKEIRPFFTSLLIDTPVLLPITVTRFMQSVREHLIPQLFLAFPIRKQQCPHENEKAF